MIKLLRLLQGYVIFEASGGFTERFLNLCRNNNINLWNVKNDGVKVVAFTSEAEFLRIASPAENSGMDINILKRKGLPFFARTHKWRCGAVLGIFLVVVIMWLASGFIWNVEIVSTNGVKIDGFTDKIKDLGVKTGARKSKIDILDIQEQLLDSFSQLSWVSLNIFGTKAQIEYTYAKPQLPITDKKAYTNVIAEKDGCVVLVEGYSGTNVVKKGEFVTKGSLLITGVVTNADLTETLVHASGKVFAQTTNMVTGSVVSRQSQTFVQSSKSIYSFSFFGLVIPFGKTNSSTISSETQMFLEGNNTLLPIGIIRTDEISVEEKSFTFSEEECCLKNLLYCVSEKRRGFGDVELESVKYSKEKTGDMATVVAEIKCVENIAREVPLQIE